MARTSFNAELNEILPQETPSVVVEKNEEMYTDIPNSIIVATLPKRFHSNANILLQELKKSNEISLDKFSMVSIEKKELNTTIFQLMKISFFPIKKNLAKYQPYIELLKRLNLEEYVKNKNLFANTHSTEIEMSKYWYYIGN